MKIEGETWHMTRLVMRRSEFTAKPYIQWEKRSISCFQGWRKQKREIYKNKVWCIEMVEKNPSFSFHE